MITSYYVKVDGVKIYVETNNGPKENGTMCCFVSAGRESRQYHGIMDYYTDKFEVICFDMPGHGKSWPLPGNQCLDNYVDFCEFIIRTFEVLGIENPICLGAALGGNACFYLAQHTKIRAIVSMTGTDYSPFVAQSVIDNLDHPYANVQHGQFDFTDSLIGSAVSQENREFILWGLLTECGRTKKADYGGVYNGFDVRKDMDKITCPCLILRGGDDWSENQEMHDVVMARMTNCSYLDYRVIPGIAHYHPQEAPELIGDVIIDFLQKSQA